MKSRKVIFLHHGVGASGADISLLFLIKGLRERGVTCTVACLRAGTGALPFYRSHGIKAFDCKTDFFPHTTGGWNPLFSPLGIFSVFKWILQYRKASSNLSSALLAEGPDIVHLNSITLAPYLRTISSLGYPTVLHVRERIHQGSFGIRRFALRQIALRYASSVIFICKDNLNHLMGDSRNGDVIYNPVDFGVFDKDLDPGDLRNRLGVSNGDRVILFAGGSGLMIKGIIPFLKSLHILKKKCFDFKGIMLGIASEPSHSLIPTIRRRGANFLGVYSLRQRIHRLVKDYRLENNVISLPFVNDIEKYYAISDVVAVPFVEPHFARQVIEAGAMAKPVVASRIGGIDEVVIDNRTGILVPPRDPLSLANGITQILSDPISGRKMGEYGFYKAKSEYNLEKHVNKVIGVYSLLPGKQMPVKAI